MIKLIHGYERAERRALFEQMFRHRKAVFIDQKGWDLPVTEGVFEIDNFDRDDTVYILSVDAGGGLLGSVRLVNTTFDHMATTVFATMFPGLVIRSPTIWEATRFAVPVPGAIQPNKVSRAACEVLLGMSLFGLEAGVSQMTAIYEQPMARVYRRCGLSNIVLGRHTTSHHGSIEFGLWDISRALEGAIRTATGIDADIGLLAA